MGARADRRHRSGAALARPLGSGACGWGSKNDDRNGAGPVRQAGYGADESMIETEGLTKEYDTWPTRRGRRVTALRDVALTIPAGGVWAVAGPNGAGKSTLFGLLLGFLRPTSGRVLLDGLEPARYLRRSGAGYLPERFRLPGEWTVSAGLRGLARLEGLDAGAASTAVAAQLERFGLVEHAGKRIGALSRGLLQRLGLAQALIGGRELIVLDEPTEGLDPLWRVRFRSLVEELRAEGRTVLVASHDLSEVERLASHVVVLEAGRVREILQVRRPSDGAQRYRIELTAPALALAEAFPGALEIGEEGESAYLVTVEDPAELSGRLAALLSAGGLVTSIMPATEPLEERVRRALSGGAA